jgi:hypothetical protein
LWRADRGERSKDDTKTSQFMAGDSTGALIESSRNGAVSI